MKNNTKNTNTDEINLELVYDFFPIFVTIIIMIIIYYD